VDFTHGRVPPERQLRVFLNFGEHGRELITSDVAARLLRLLAGGPAAAARLSGGGVAAERALRRSVFKVVPLENVGGRAKVESGELCLRKNGRGVDTNRNWDVHWGFKEKDYDPYEEAAGARPFSEPEALLLRDTLQAWRPHAWVNVHSGMRALFVPFDHVAAVPTGPKGDALSAILQQLKRVHCPDCVIGSGGAQVGYLAHGTATDYVYLNLSVPVAMTWEIYGDLMATRDDCFRMFNPLGRTEYEQVVSSWAAACAALPGVLALHPDVPQPGPGEQGGEVEFQGLRARLGRRTPAAMGAAAGGARAWGSASWAAGSVALLAGVAAASYASGRRMRRRGTAQSSVEENEKQSV